MFTVSPHLSYGLGLYELDTKNEHKSIYGVVELSTCHPVGETDGTHLVRCQQRIWQDRKRFTHLDGSYVKWAINNFWRLTAPHQLAKETFVGGTPHAADKVHADSIPAIRSLPLHAGGVVGDVLLARGNHVLLQIPTAILSMWPQPEVLITPAYWATRHNLELQVADDEPAVDPGPGAFIVALNPLDDAVRPNSS